jgi:hypothetical protein
MKNFPHTFENLCIMITSKYHKIIVYNVYALFLFYFIVFRFFCGKSVITINENYKK